MIYMPQGRTAVTRNYLVLLSQSRPRTDCVIADASRILPAVQVCREVLERGSLERELAVLLVWCCLGASTLQAYVLGCNYILHVYLKPFDTCIANKHGVLRSFSETAFIRWVPIDKGQQHMRTASVQSSLQPVTMFVALSLYRKAGPTRIVLLQTVTSRVLHQASQISDHSCY